MDIEDARKVTENLQTRPYICSENTIELDNGYVIAKKDYFKELQETRKRQMPKKPMRIRLLETSGVHCGICSICKNPVYADLSGKNHREYCGIVDKLLIGDRQVIPCAENATPAYAGHA